MNYKKYLVELLVELGASVDIVDNRGRTPMGVVLEAVEHLETYRGSAVESIPIDLRSEIRDISRLLYKDGATYVVAPDGNDASPGTFEEPLKTIVSAIDLASPGDTIVVRGGTYVCSRVINFNLFSDCCLK